MAGKRSKSFFLIMTRISHGRRDILTTFLFFYTTQTEFNLIKFCVRRRYNMQQPYGSEGSDGVASPDDRDETAESELLASTNGKQKQNHNFTN
jgi:hypothetical protein